MLHTFKYTSWAEGKRGDMGPGLYHLTHWGCILVHGAHYRPKLIFFPKKLT